MEDERGHLDDACRGFESRLEADPRDADAHYQYGNLLRERGDADGALARYASALELDPGNAEAHHNIALLLRQRGSMDEARDHYRAALRLDPQSAQAAANLARLSLVRGEIAEGLDHALQAIRLKSLPDNGVRMAGWFSRRQADLERIVAEPDQSAERRGSAMALLIAERPAEASSILERMGGDPHFSEAGRICIEVLDLWSPSVDE